ncbi:barstar family protein [Actinoplanes sp. NPDC049316]|uniref:barstar family protein n=1 Tax=Actinoplanes sp. NPDC049316 TaxID=3154727 RepID=UPI003439F784
MTGSAFWDVTDNHLTVVDEQAKESLLDVFPRSGTIAVARLDGAALPDEDSVFLGFYEAFRFPDYFGWNWDALSDCLRDLGWHTADRYLILIDHAERALGGDRRQRRLLFSTLRRAAAEWANPMLSGRAHPVPFQVVLVCSPEEVDAVRGEIGVIEG